MKKRKSQEVEDLYQKVINNFSKMQHQNNQLDQIPILKKKFGYQLLAQLSKQELFEMKKR